MKGIVIPAYFIQTLAINQLKLKLVNLLIQIDKLSVLFCWNKSVSPYWGKNDTEKDGPYIVSSRYKMEVQLYYC